MDQNLPQMEELKQLITLMASDELDAEGHRRIEEIVRSDEEAQRYFIHSMLLSGELRWASGYSPSDTEALLGPVISEAEADSEIDGLGTNARQRAAGPHSSLDAERPRRWPGSIRQSSSRRRIGVAVAAGLLVTFLGGLIYRGAPPSTGDSVVVATLESDADCVWAGRGEIGEGDELYSGDQLTLVAGNARLSFGKGATVLVESPSAIQLLSDASLRLLAGTVGVRASGDARDFAVISSDTAIVDLGTTFAVYKDDQQATEVEVFEGAVEVFPGHNVKKGRVLGMGENVSFSPRSKDIYQLPSPPGAGRFTNVLERIWPDMRVEAASDDESVETSSVEAEFTDDEPSAVDGFYNSKPGKGWVTPWVAAGNPSAAISRGDHGWGLDNPFLRVKFSNSHERSVAREYGARGTFDPSEPHVISWQWRLEGNPETFGGEFHDRIAFYGNPFFRRNSWPTNSWLIGVAGGNEQEENYSDSTEWLKEHRGLSDDDEAEELTVRTVYPKRWYLFDNRDASPSGAVFDRRNKIDTGMPLKFNELYHFAVAVYPREGRYDVAIRDDEETVVHQGMAFRNSSTDPANVLHFSLIASDPNDEVGYSLDSIHIRQLEGDAREALKSAVEKNTGGETREETGDVERGNDADFM